MIDRFLNDATEVDVDAICDGKSVFVAGIMEHIEEAGIHSGDSACSLPPYTLNKEIIKKIEIQTGQLAKALKVIGLINIQFAVKANEIYVLKLIQEQAERYHLCQKQLDSRLRRLPQE